jgi:hypothetical protein
MHGTMNLKFFNMVQDWDKWRVVVNGVMNLQVPLNAENFLTA